jgi:hypothetical protein
MPVSIWDAAEWRCKECIALTRELASATFEAVAIQRHIMAGMPNRKNILAALAAQFREAKRVASEANNAFDAHRQSHNPPYLC